MRKILADKWIDIGALILAALALWFSYLSYQAATGANQISQEANEVAQESNQLSQEANQKSDEANALSKEANEVAHGANKLSEDANQLSQEANELARTAVEEARPQVEVIAENLEDNLPIYSEVCRTGTQYLTYTVSHQFKDTVTFVNRGGRTVSLLDFDFYEKGKPSGNTAIYEGDYFSADREQPLNLPLDIESGSAETWTLETRFIHFFQTEEEVTRTIEERSPSSPIGWRFYFSDGTIITTEYPNAWYMMRSNLDTAAECA